MILIVIAVGIETTKKQIGTDGNPIGLTALNSIVDERLKAAAIEAVMQWRYRPTLLNGRPVEVVATISVAFEPT